MPFFIQTDKNRVAPLAGAWIETGLADLVRVTDWGRAPRGRVD